MHRSGSTSRASKEYYMSMTARGGAKGLSSTSPGHIGSSLQDVDHLPLSDAAKKEALPTRFAENMVHLIPLVLILCAMVLWFFSQSHHEIDAVITDDSMVARIKNMTIDGYSSWNGSSMTMGLEDLDPIGEIGMEEDAARDSNDKDNEKRGSLLSSRKGMF